MDRGRAIVANTQPFVASALPKELGAEKVQRAARQNDLVPVMNVGVGQVHGQQRVVFLYRGAKKERPFGPELEHKYGQESRALVEQALLAQADLADVAVGIEDGKRLALFEDAAVFGPERGGSVNVKRVFGGEDCRPTRTHRAVANLAHASVLYAAACPRRTMRVFGSAIAGPFWRMTNRPIR